MHSPDMLEENFGKLAALFPSAVTETTGEDGKPRRAVDADALRQLIGADVAESRKERALLRVALASGMRIASSG